MLTQKLKFSGPASGVSVLRLWQCTSSSPSLIGWLHRGLAHWGGLTGTAPDSAFVSSEPASASGDRGPNLVQGCPRPMSS